MKLNASIRENIRKDLIRHRFEGDESALGAQEMAIGDAIYDRVYSKKDRELMDSLPDYWMTESSCPRVQIGAYHIGIRLSKPRRIQERHRNYLAVIDASDPIADRYMKLKADRSDLKAAKKAAELDITSVLQSTTSVERLRAIWPDAVQFIDKHAVEPAGLPAVRIPDLNARLGLPPKAEPAPRSRKAGAK